MSHATCPRADTVGTIVEIVTLPLPVALAPTGAPLTAWAGPRVLPCPGPPGRPLHGRNAVPETGIIRPVTADEAAKLAPEVARLLRVVPETWGTLDMAAMTAAQERALWLLTAAEMVARRLRFRVSMATAPTSLEAVITATGGEGFAEAMEPILAKAWSLWGERFKAWNAGDARETTPFIVESVPPREWRLTESGVLARNDHDAGDTGGIDFVLWRGNFDGRPRRTPDGRVFARPEVVRGSGRVERLIEHVVAPELPRVNTANWPEGADAIAGRLVPDLTAKLTEFFKAHAPAPADGVDPERSDRKRQWLADAMLLVRDHPEWSDAKIADKVCISKSTLSRSPEFQAAANIARDPKKAPPRGRADGSGGIEAEAPAVPVVGEPVPGSRRGLRWERCAQCDEWLHVAADMVGMSPLCHHCGK